MTQILRPAALLAFLALASPALAQDPAQCATREQINGGTVDVSAAIDMGGGIVAQSTASYGDNGAGLVNVHEQTRFELCATGRAIEVWGNHLPNPDVPLPDVAAIVLDAINTREPVTLEEITDRINSSTSWGASLIEASATESCGCAVFYLGLHNAQ